MTDFGNKTILVVGASSGIGEETARTLAKNGAKVVLVARREDKLKKVCESIDPGLSSYYAGDVREIDNIDALVDRIVKEQGKLDGMVYVAGTTDADVPLKFLTYEKHLNTFNINYFGFVEFVRQTTKRGRYNPGMRIVAISSTAAIIGSKAHLAYSASKAAIDSAVRCLARELGEKGICLNTVAPSMIHTDMYNAYLENNGLPADSEAGVSERQYLGIGKPADVANAITFLMSEEARFITGIMLPVDGGFSTS